MTSRETNRATSRDAGLKAGREAGDVERALADLSGDPLLAGQEGAPAPVIVWDASIARVLYASDAAATMRALVADPSGRVRLDRPALDRLKALAGGLADRERFRLELVRLGGDRSTPATMLACRRLDLGGGPVLLTVIVGGAPSLRRTVPDLAAASQPPAAVDEPPVVRLVPDRPAEPAKRVEPEPEPKPESEPEPVAEPEPAETPRPWDEPAASEDATPERLRGAMPRRFLWSTDAAGRITSVSAGLATAVGAKHGNIVGRSWAELADRALLDPMGTVARHMASGRAWRDVEVAWRLAEPGRVVPVTLGAMPVRSPEGVIEGFRGSGLVRLPETARLGVPQDPVSRDPEVETPPPAGPPPTATTLSFSERGALHEIARALGGRFDPADEERETGRSSAEIIPLPAARPREPDPLGLLDRLPVGIAIFRGETPIHLNATLLAWLGYADLAEIVAQGALQALCARDGPATLALATRSGASVSVEAEGAGIAWGDLPARLVTVTRRPDGDPAARLAAAELDLAAAHARHATLAATLDLAGIGAATLDGTGRILSLNGPARRLLGYEEREVAGEPFATLLAPASRPAFSVWLNRPGPDHGEPDEEHRLVARLRDGAEVPLLVRGARTGTEGAEAILVWREAPAETGPDGASEPLPPLPARILARVSHEILTPANAIVGVAGQMLEERPGPTRERDRTQLRDIARSGEQVAALASDLLDLSQMASGSGRLEPTSLDLNGLVAESVARLQPAASRERVIVRTSLGPDLARVVADERSLRQIAFSVLSNAIRDTGAGGQVIVSTARTERGETAFRVRDTGARSPSAGAAPKPSGGVSAAVRDPVRDPLAELSLPLSQALAEANRATFRVASDGAHGTLVEVVFPAAQDAAE